MKKTTRLPKDTNTVFSHAGTHAEAYRLASLFLGGKGRIASMRDIVEARIRLPFSHPIWKNSYVTTSTEWVGKDKSGKLVMGVIDNPGPLADQSLLRSVYGKRGENNISREIFLEVLDGKYGECYIIEFKDALDAHNKNYELEQYLRAKYIIGLHPLLRNRVEPLIRPYDYIKSHLMKSTAGLIEKDLPINDYIINCSCYDYNDFPEILLNIALK